jgi:hypothetical protein
MTRHIALDVFVVRKLRLAPVSLLVAVPPGSPARCRELTDTTDEIVWASAPEYFAAVGPVVRRLPADDRYQSSRAVECRRVAGAGWQAAVRLS